MILLSPYIVVLDRSSLAHIILDLCYLGGTEAA
jgi:hypothetical protein